MSNSNLASMDKQDLLKRAKDHIFSLGLKDAASRLCQANMQYGLAKFHIVQERNGIRPDATFISTPDETVTRNTERWNGGIGYGGKIAWGSGREKLVILDVMPNACGMLVGGLEELPESKDIINNIANLAEEEVEVDGIPINWDFGVGNHFIDVFKVSRVLPVDLPNYAFIIHSGTIELKADNPKGFGLYIERSAILRDMAEVASTPFGKCHFLLGSDAREYYEFSKYAEGFSARRRSLAAERIFGEYREIANVCHQGLDNMNEIRLGVQDTTGGDRPESLLPIALRDDLPAYLVKGLPNLSEEVIKTQGFKDRAERLGVMERLTGANIAPHGGGYAFPDLLNVGNIVETSSARYFVIEMDHTDGQKIVSNLKGLRFNYRGRTIIVSSLELGLVKIATRLIPEYILKI